MNAPLDLVCLVCGESCRRIVCIDTRDHGRVECCADCAEEFMRPYDTTEEGWVFE